MVVIDMGLQVQVDLATTLSLIYGPVGLWAILAMP